MVEELNKVFKAYLDLTGKNPNDNSIRLGVESDVACLNATELLKKDATGLLSSLSMRRAYKKYSEEHTFCIEELMYGCWDEVKPKVIKLENLLYAEKIGAVCDKLFNLIVKHCMAIGKKFTKQYIENFYEIEDIIIKAVEKFNSPYYFHHEKFSDGKTKVNKDVNILPKLYRFNYLKLFVDSMKKAKEDNFICLALIDRTYEKIENEYYDSNFDSFFAFGFKNNGVVYVVSDRVTYDSPEGAFKTRNPGRNFRDKVDFSWMPYTRLDEIKAATQNTSQALLTFNDNISNINGNKIIELFDESSIIYSVLIMTLIYNKYFCEEVEDNSRKYFSDEIKLLENNLKALVLTDELHLPTPANNIKADSYKFNDKIYSNSMYEYLIDLYPLEISAPILQNFIGDKETAEKYIWWNIRKQQYNHIINCLNESYYNNKYLIEQWQRDCVIKNMKDIIEFMLTSPDKNCFIENYRGYFAKESAKPLLWEDFRDNKTLETYTLKTYKDTLYDSNSKHGVCLTTFGEVQYTSYGNYTYLTFTDDVKNKPCCIELTLRSHSDLERFFKLSNDELPIEMRKHIYSRLDGFSKSAWEPYTGNSILDFTDPMNDIKNPFDEIGCTISLFVSKSKLKKLGRKIQEK